MSRTKIFKHNCIYCGHMITREEVEEGEAILVNPDGARSPVVNSKWAHLQCKKEDEEE